MDLGENIKKSFAYPLCDYNKFAMIGVLSVFSVLYSVCSSFAWDNPGVIVISVLISSIFFVYLMGFSVSVIECGINLKEKIPDFKVGRDISNFFKYLALSIVYGIVPGIIIFITILGSGILKIFTDISLYSIWKYRYSSRFAFQLHVCFFDYSFSNSCCNSYSVNFY